MSTERPDEDERIDRATLRACLYGSLAMLGICALTWLFAWAITR